MPSHFKSLARRSATQVLVALGVTLLTAQLQAQSPAFPVVGDVNGDGSVSAVDALGVLNHAVGRTLPADFIVPLTGDANGDGAVTAVDALVILSFAVGRDVSQFPVGQALNASVAVLCGAGVAGNLESGTMLVPRGRTVAYRFVPEPGFEGLRVTLDGAAVADSGTVTASTAHLLVASASPVVVVPPGDVPLVAEARAMLSAPDAAGRYQALVDRMAALPPAEAERQLRLAAATALHGVRDSASIRRLGEALAGRYFEASGGSAAARATTAGGDSPVAGSLPSTLLYINGIHSDPFASMATGLGVQRLAQERLGWTFGGGSAHRFGRFYNQTWADSPHAGGFQCLLWAVSSSGWPVDPAGVYDWYRQCLGEIDLLEAGAQWANAQVGHVLPLDEQARSFGERMRGEIREGRGVVVVAHSQGNLMTQEALASLPQSALRCVAVVSLAPPTTEGWPRPRMAAHGSLFARGERTQDILLTVLYDRPGKTPAAELMATDTTRRHDADLELLESVLEVLDSHIPGFPNLTALVEAQKLVSDFALHGADASYLAGDATRTRTAELIGASDAALGTTCADSVAIAPRSGTVQVDSSITLTAEVFNPLGEKLAVPRVEWRSAIPSRATVDAEGRVTGRDTGQVWIHATHGDHARDSVAVRVKGDSIVIQNATRMTASMHHTCALTAAGEAYCWGSGWSGQLGNGSGASTLVPTAVSGGLAFETISTGWTHTCALTAAGRAYCWGYNDFGALGNGTTTRALTPTAVSGEHTFVSISARYEHSCGLTAAGKAYCWGFNEYGVLGNGSTTHALTPTPVSGGLAFASISAGLYHTCALTTAGQAYCWGSGATTGALTPTPVSEGLVFASISAGGAHTCALTTAGQAYCWGYNEFGQLGNSFTTDALAPVAVSGGLTFTSILAGAAHTCALTAAGEAYCWGRNYVAEINRGDANALAPVAVSGGLVFGAISAGGEYNCALTMTGQAYCWGYNWWGVLGTGSVENALAPTAVLGGLLFPPRSGQQE
jgi:alpha-tubulin suppressor-like RCC1 family protein